LYIGSTTRVKQWKDVDLTEQEAVSIVQKIRNEKGMGPIADYNMPGYVSSEEEDEAIIADIERLSAGDTSSLHW